MRSVPTIEAEMPLRPSFSAAECVKTSRANVLHGARAQGAPGNTPHSSTLLCGAARTLKPGACSVCICARALAPRATTCRSLRGARGVAERLRVAHCRARRPRVVSQRLSQRARNDSVPRLRHRARGADVLRGLRLRGARVLRGRATSDCAVGVRRGQGAAKGFRGAYVWDARELFGVRAVSSLRRARPEHAFRRRRVTVVAL